MVNERKQVCQGSAASEENKFDVMEEKFKSCNKEVTRNDKEESLGEKEREAKKIEEKRKISTLTRKKKEQVTPQNFLDFIPPSPFPTAEKVKEQKKEFVKFTELIRRIHVNMSLVDLITCIPSYAKFVKEIAANKDRYFDEEVIPQSNSSVV